jgi:hypothetical protein
MTITKMLKPIMIAIVDQSPSSIVCSYLAAAAVVD